MRSAEVNGLTVTIDPLDEFSNFDDRAIFMTCGVVPFWFTPEKPFIECVTDNYVFPVHPIEGGSLSENGVYSYPQDPDLFPLISIQTDAEEAFIYRMAILAIRNKSTGEVFVTRVD